MNHLNDPARVSLLQQFRSAETLSEVRASRLALRRWRQQYPQDWSILDAGEELSLLEDALLEDDSPPGMSPRWTEWQRLEYRVMGARTLPDIAAARRDLQHWVDHHPAEVQSEWVETLFFLLEVVEAGQTGEAVTEVQNEREPAGLAA